MTHLELWQFVAEKLAPEQAEPNIMLVDISLLVFMMQANDIAPLDSAAVAVAIVAWQWLHPNKVAYHSE